ncbi:TPA: bacterioferritin-associated ferredoxin [Providencia rettgeri]|uniref:bacterioferritin-associated ferredoxin n=1 Tax=Providencia sp. Me31A TaxID=3392637 RepID=UPI0038C57CF4
MYVCLCEAITDKQIRNAARRYQASSLKGLQQILPLGLECGKCIRQAKAILREEQMLLEDICAIEVA